MDTKKKVAIGCGLAFGLFALAMVGLGLWARSAMMDLREEGRTTIADAESFGRGRSSDACIEEGFRRLDACTGLMCRATSSAFLESCLRVCERDPMLCADIPPQSEIMASANWSVAYCRARGVADQQSCTQFVGAIQRACR